MIMIVHYKKVADTHAILRRDFHEVEDGYPIFIIVPAKEYTVGHVRINAYWPESNYPIYEGETRIEWKPTK